MIRNQLIRNTLSIFTFCTFMCSHRRHHNTISHFHTAYLYGIKQFVKHIFSSFVYVYFLFYYTSNVSGFTYTKEKELSFFDNSYSFNTIIFHDFNRRLTNHFSWNHWKNRRRTRYSHTGAYLS